MISNDQAIAYETKKYQVEKSIKALEAINLNVTNFKIALEEIDTNCKKNVNYSSVSSGDTAVAFSGLLENAYITGISKLDSLYLEVKRYEIYVQVSAFNSYLRKFLNTGNISEEKMGEIRNQLVNFLNAIKNSDTLDYEVKGPIVEDIYNLTLSFIELETKTFGSSALIPLLSIDDIHRYNLDKAIVRRLEKIDLKSLKYHSIKIKKDEIDKNGFDSTYLNQEFISILASTDLDEEQVKKTISELLVNMENYEGRMNDILNDISWNNNYIKDKEEDKKSASRRFYKKIALVASYFGLFASMVTGTILLGKKLGTDVKYEASITRYSKERGMSQDFLYVDTKEDSIKVLQYSPYFKTEEGYSRNVISYDIEETGENLEDYLAIDYSEYIGESSEETKDSLSIEDQYTESYLEVVKTEINTDVQKEEINVSIIGGLILTVIALVLWLLEEIIYEKVYFKSLDEDMFISKIFGDLKATKNELKAIKNNLKTYQDSLTDSEKELLELQQLSLKTISIAQKTLRLIENIPEFSKEKAKLETALAKVRKLSDQ